MKISILLACSCLGLLSPMRVASNELRHTNEDHTSPKFFSILMSAPTGAAYSLQLKSGVLLYSWRTAEHVSRRKIMLPDNEHWHAFWTTVESLDLWNWRRKYEPYKEDGGKSDVETWSVHIVYNGKQVNSTADGVYPSDKNSRLSERGFLKSNRFAQFEKAAARLIDAKSLYNGENAISGR